MAAKNADVSETLVKVVWAKQNNCFGRWLPSQSSKESDHQPAGEKMVGQDSTADSLSSRQRRKRVPSRLPYSIEKRLRIIAPEREVLVSRPCIRNRQHEASNTFRRIATSVCAARILQKRRVPAWRLDAILFSRGGISV